MNNYIGAATCTGGEYPDPPIDAYPLLVWVDGVICTEDKQVNVDDIAHSMAELFSTEAVAERFNTTPDHVIQAINYITGR